MPSLFVSQARVTPEAFRNGMRRVAAACAIITAQDGHGARAGLTATAICSVTTDPPRLLVCVNRNASAYETIVGAGALGVNILPDSHQHLAHQFAGLNGASRAERFSLGSWTSAVTGAPILADAVVAFDCRITETIAASTHDIFLCDVVEMLLAAQGEPLLYFDGAFSRLAAGPGAPGSGHGAAPDQAPPT